MLMGSAARPSIGRRALTRNPLAVGWATRVPRSIVGPFPHPDEPAPLVRWLDDARRARAALVVHGDLERFLAVAHDDARATAARVLERVRERLLDDPVRRDREARVEHPRLALDDQLHLEAGGSELLEQLVHAVEPGRRVRGLLVAQDPQHPAHVRERQAARRRDRLERRARLVGPLLDDPQGAACLDHDHADVVGDDVVQLAGDPLPLVAHRPFGLLVTVALHLLRALLERARVQPADAGRVTEQPRHEEDQLRLHERREHDGDARARDEHDGDGDAR